MTPPIGFEQMMNLAFQHHQAGRLGQAEELYRQILGRHPNHPETYFNLGSLLDQIGKKADAFATLQKAIALRPNFPMAYNILGKIFKEQGHVQQAIAAVRQAVTLQPDFYEAWFNLGTLLYDTGQFDHALLAARQAASPQNAPAQAHNLLGNSLHAADKLDEAILSYRRAVELQPQFAEAQNNLGTTLLELRRFDEALGLYEQAIATDPNHALAHHNVAMLLLLRGDFDRGWREMEWRWKSRAFETQRSPHAQPIWDGSDPSGKTIFIFPEQGLGDVIQFVRYAPLLAARGAKVIVGCQKALQALLRTVPGVSAVASHPSETPPFDLQISVASLPLRFATTLSTIPNAVPYIHANPSKSVQWKQRMSGISGLKVGLVWAGRPQHPRDRERSIRLEALAPLAAVKDVHFFSLQKGPASDQANNPPNGMILTDWTADLKDFDDTAALIDNLDLVISVDTSVAHLAGAMGKPVCIMLTALPDWRWLLDRNDSPWYPTARLFRQASPGNWHSVISKVAQTLATFSS